MQQRVIIQKAISDSKNAGTVFINRNIFSNYYLGTLLSREMSKLQGEIGSRMSQQNRLRLRRIWDRIDGLSEKSSLLYTRKLLLDPILNLLGFETLDGVNGATFNLPANDKLPPGYRLYSPPGSNEAPATEPATLKGFAFFDEPSHEPTYVDNGNEGDEGDSESESYTLADDEQVDLPGMEKIPGVLLSLLPWGQDLDQTFSTSSRRDDTPARLMERLLASGPVQWGLLFNGQRLRLMKNTVISGRQHYFEVDLEALCENGEEENFDIFWMLFRAQSFHPSPDGRCPLDIVDEESRKHATRVSSELKYSVYSAVETLMRALVERATELTRQTINPEDIAALQCQQTAQKALADLKQLYEESLVFLYRLLFIFYSESRHLLPIEQPIYRDSYSLEPLRDEIEQPGRVYLPSSYRLWETLQSLFRLIRNGCNAGQLVVPAYNGSLFHPRRTTLIDVLRVSDQALRNLLSDLSQTPESRGRSRERIDYSDLGVEQLGSVYEGLLEFEPRIAREPMVEVRYKDNRVVIPARSNLKEGEGTPLYQVMRSFATGDFYLGRGAGRKVSGSYYTPQPLVDFLVRRTLEPLVKGRSAAEILQLKVVDPAMGSGAFLVGACLYLAQEYARALKAERTVELALRPRTNVSASTSEEADEVGEADEMEEEKEASAVSESELDTDIPAESDELSEEETLPYRRLVAENCLYGVDLNEMAVELAKVSLWLVTLAGDKPLTFLDANLRCGNSLIGAPLIPYRAPSGTEYFAERIHPEALKRLARAYGKKLVEAPAAPRVDASREGLFKGLMPETVAPLLKFRRWIAETPSDSLEQVHIKEGFMKNLEENDKRRANKQIGDLWVASWFWHQPAAPDSKAKEKAKKNEQKKTELAQNLTLFNEFSGTIQPDQQAAASVSVQVEDVPAGDALPALNGRVYAELVSYFKGQRKLESYMTPFLTEIERIIKQVKPFHWELEFPEIFLNDDETKREHAGFDAILGNPPWETVKPYSQEFFSAYDPGFRDLERVKAEKRQRELCTELEVNKKWNEYEQEIGDQVEYIRKSEVYPYQSVEVNGKLTGGDTNTYQLFLERAYRLLNQGGSCGIIVPSGLYTDLSCTGLRQLFLSQTQISHLICFENRLKIFPIHRSFKFVLFGFQKILTASDVQAAFMLQDLSVLSSLEEVALAIPAKLVRRFSPDTYSIIEFRSQKDVNTLSHIFKDWPLLGEKRNNDWQVLLTSEFHMTNDRYLFNQEQKGWPLYEGKMMHKYTHRFSEPNYWVEPTIGNDELARLEIKRVEKALDIAAELYNQYPTITNRHDRVLELLETSGRGPLDANDVCITTEAPRLVFRSVGRNTDERTMIATILPSQVFFGHSLFHHIPWRFDAYKALSQLNNIKACYDPSLQAPITAYLCGVINSFIIEYVLRFKVSANISMFHVYQLPVPRLTPSDLHCRAIAHRVARLVCVGSEFDDLRCELLGDVGAAVLPFEEQEARQQVQNEIDALVAHLYGLSEGDLEHILYAPYTFPLVKREIKDGVMREFARVERLLREG